MPIKDPVKRKEYHRLYLKNRYDNDPEYKKKHLEHVKKANLISSEKRRALINEFKKDGCAICGEKRLFCLVAHHLNPVEKEFNIANSLNMRYKIEKVKEELLKCICVCSNCHLGIHSKNIFL